MDLLSLLAQQEVELSVFRQAIADSNEEMLDEVEKNAQQSVVKLYGSYTNFRKNSEFF